MPHIQLKDVNLYYEQQGEGPNLVMVAGLGVDHSMWNTEYFAKDFCVTVLDNRGAGQSSTPKGPWSMKVMAADVIALCDALGIKKAHFVGHSMGGHITQMIGALYPQYCDKLVIACSEQFFSIISRLATNQQIVLMNYNLPPRVLLQNYLPLLFSMDFLENEDKVNAFLDFMLDNPYAQSPEGYILQTEALRTHDSRPLLERIKAPSLILGCEDDLLTPLKNSQYLEKHISNATLKVIPNCGHAPFVEYPEMFNQMILDYLKN
ncbi:alpha/beta fold hydrolase [Legionella israelensis]|uniref:alpha/beta fold hydrolase n=1 Tax=Legionella israelensis TaxID=454 RepID=UPI00117F1CD4|nr:alpha/beta hydrolase [Legionella israelensis]QDP72323.1 alpha/beta fold hydrolase [Legionella israelensis]